MSDAVLFQIEDLTCLGPRAGELANLLVGQKLDAHELRYLSVAAIAADFERGENSGRPIVRRYELSGVAIVDRSRSSRFSMAVSSAQGEGYGFYRRLQDEIP